MPQVQIDFWAVGQGLFSSGRIVEDNQEFIWVYDCGSTKQENVKNAVNKMTQYYSQSTIDLLAISHFDKDHISGLPELLQNKSVKYWLLPYYSLWDRLLIAWELQISPQNPAFEFYVDPVAYISNLMIEKGSKTTVLFLLQNIDSKPITPVDFAMESNHLQFRKLSESQLASFDEIQKWKSRDDNINVELLDPTTPLYYKGIEFVPYNVPLSILAKAPNNLSTFQTGVERILADTTLTPEQRLNDLKDHYDQYFVRRYKKKSNKYENNGKDRNIISLFLAIGGNAVCYHGMSNQVKNIHHSNMPNQQAINYQTLVFYTGDGYLDTKKQVDQLYQVMGQNRMENICCWQVPHHGSEHNWLKGLADDIQPQFSLFSANPNKRPHHPDQMVWRDLANYSPFLINQPHSSLHFYFQ